MTDESEIWEILWYVSGQDVYDGREAWREPLSGTREDVRKYAQQQLRLLGYHSFELVRIKK